MIYSVFCKGTNKMIIFENFYIVILFSKFEKNS